MGIFDVTRAAFQHTTLFDNDPKRDWDFVALKAREVLEKAVCAQAARRGRATGAGRRRTRGHRGRQEGKQMSGGEVINLAVLKTLCWTVAGAALARVLAVAL